MFLAFSIHFQQVIVFLFVVTLLLRVDSFAAKSVFFLTKFAHNNLTLKTAAAKVLNSEVVIYLS